MSTTGRSQGEPPSPSDVAPRLRDAGFVRLVAAADGDALAGAGVLADVLDHYGVPFQLTVARPWDRTGRETDADLIVALGGPATAADLSITGDGRPVSHTAFEAGRELGTDPDAVLAMAGLAAVDGPVGTLADAAGLDREPGVAVPTDDPADGLAHSTLVHAGFSGDSDAAAEALTDIDTDAEDADRRVASLVALAVVGTGESTARASEAVERALRPYAGGPFETIGGYADVLDAVARRDPGTAAALAVGADVHDTALDAWRRHAEAAHAALRSATVGRYDGLTVVRSDDSIPVGTVARLCLDYRSMEPAVVALGAGRAAGAATAAAAVDFTTLFASAFDGTVAGIPTRATATFEDDTANAALTIREVLDS